MLRPLVRPLVRALTRSPMESRGLRPALSLDFTNGGVPDSRITFSGGANGTRVNSAGLIVAATTPRFDYNPVTLAPLGLLVEEARTNLCLNSGDWSTGLVLATAAPVTPATGGLCNQRISFTASAAAVTAKLNAAGNSTLQYANTVRLKAASFSGCIVSFRNAAQTIGIQYTVNLTAVTLTDVSYGSPTSKITPSIRLVGGGEYEVTFGGVLNAGGGAETTLFCVFNPGSTAGTLDVGAGQIEVGGFDTSYIGPTAGASVARTSDSALMTGSNFSSWYNQAGGSAVVQFDLIAVSGTRPIISFDDNTANERIELYATGTDLRMKVTDGGATQVDMSIGTVAANTTYKAAIAWAANDFAGCLNGGTVATDASGTLPAPDRLRIGSDQAGNFQCGHGKTLQAFALRLPNATLQGMTA